MPNNLYGVDIKIQPDGTPQVIEVNGVDFGTDFFKYPEGWTYYTKLVRVIATHNP